MIVATSTQNVLAPKLLAYHPTLHVPAPVHDAQRWMVRVWLAGSSHIPVSVAKLRTPMKAIL
jgi:hypothetical protein